MRRKMAANLESGADADTERDEKHGAGGLIDIEFIAQLGVLASAHGHPEVIVATSTTEQLLALSQAGWLSEQDAGILLKVMDRLHERRMMTALVDCCLEAQPGMADAAKIFEKKFVNRS